MPGIDFDRLRREIPVEDVLHLVGFEPCQATGDQWYGGCPLHGSTADRARHFSGNVASRRYCCHKCHSHGNRWNSGPPTSKSNCTPRWSISATRWDEKSPGFDAGDEFAEPPQSQN